MGIPFHESMIAKAAQTPAEVQVFHLEGSGSLAAAWSTITLLLAPERRFLDMIALSVDNVAGATAVNWYLSHDSAGTLPITPLNTMPLDATTLSAVAGTYVDAALLQAASERHSGGVIGSIFLKVQTDAGTCDLAVDLQGRR
jgi:hypothetical protein